MSTLTRAAVYTVRIAAMTAAAPVLAGAAHPHFPGARGTGDRCVAYA